MSGIKKGSLKSAEKLQIQELHSNGLSIEDIASTLNRGKTIVRNYIDEFTTLINKGRETEKDNKEQERKQKLRAAILEAKTELVEGTGRRGPQLTEKQFTERLGHIMSRPKPPKTAKGIADAIMLIKPVIENMRGDNEDDSRGVIVNSEAASTVADKNKRKVERGFSRTTRGCVFSTKQQTNND